MTAEARADAIVDQCIHVGVPHYACAPCIAAGLHAEAQEAYSRRAAMALSYGGPPPNRPPPTSAPGPGVPIGYQSKWAEYAEIVGWSLIGLAVVLLFVFYGILRIYHVSHS